MKMLVDQTFSLLDHQLLIDVLSTDTIDRTRRPMDYDGIDPARSAQAEMQARITRRLKTRVRANLRTLDQSTRFYFNPGAETISIRMSSHSLDSQPVTAPGCLVSQQYRRTVQHADQQVFPAVVKKVGRGCAAGDVTSSQLRSCLQADFLQLPLPPIPKHPCPPPLVY